MDLKESSILGDDISTHWYYQSKARAIIELLANSSYTTILDVGAGSGFFSKYLLLNSSAASACCVDISYQHESDTIASKKQIQFRRSIGKSSANLVLLMDVLEHVQDDLGLLVEYEKKVPVGTLFLISVPAFEFLWSEHDIFLGHCRRYKLKQLEKIMHDAGLKIHKSGYFFASIFPAVLVLRFIFQKFFKKNKTPKSDLKIHHPITNRLLSSICKLEIPWIGKNRFAGLTIFCLAEKTK